MVQLMAVMRVALTERLKADCLVLKKAGRTVWHWAAEWDLPMVGNSACPMVERSDSNLVGW